MSRIIYILLLILLPGVVSAQNMKCGEVIPESRHAFWDKEELYYTIAYKIAFIETDVATVSFKTSRENRSGNDTYHIHAVGEVSQGYKWFFDMRDVYESWIDAKTLRPLEMSCDLKEGNYRYRSSLLYNWKTMTAESKYRNLKNPEDTKRTLKLTDCSYDGLSIFFNLRCLDTKNMKDGQSQVINLVLSDTVRNVSYTLLGREEKYIENLGRFRTLKFSCQIVADGNSFQDNSRFTIWLSDDKNKIPLYIESPIRVGKIRGRLSNWRNLKYPMECLVVK